MPTLISRDFISYLKLFAIIFFFMGFIGFIHKNPEAVDLIFKLFIFYVLIAFYNI